MSEVKREMAQTRDVVSKSGYKWLKLPLHEQRLNATEEKQRGFGGSKEQYVKGKSNSKYKSELGRTMKAGEHELSR